jgi:predicted DNA-binding ribbon-helix-helix protein
MQQVFGWSGGLGANSVGLGESSVLALSRQAEPMHSCKESSASLQGRISVAVPRSLHKKLKLLAHDRDMTVSALLIKLIKAEVQ